MQAGIFQNDGSDLLGDLTLDKIDFEWIKNQKSIKHLKKAIKLIENDGNYFIDLRKACEQRIIEIDPKQAPKNFSNVLEPEEQEELNKDIHSFIDQQQEKEKQKQEKLKNSNQIWQDEQQQQKQDENIELSEEQKKQRSENEKNKGNEALKSHDFKEALQYYSKSIEYDPFNAASYSNRSLVYLKLKEYDNAIKDATRAIGLQNSYTKAYHRRGKAYFALKKYSEAYQDFKFIMDREPNNNEVNGDLQECKKMLPKEATTEQGFKRVQIVEEEDNDEEDEDKKQQELLKENSEEEKQRKAEYQSKIDKIETKKQEANKLIQNGMYENAIKIFQDCLQQIQGLGPYNQKEQEQKLFLQRKANFYNNIGLCYKQLDDNKSVIEYCGKVIDLRDYLERDVLVKAFLRRALSYEKLEKFNQAQNDFFSIKEIEPGNRNASEGLSRVSSLVTQTKKPEVQQPQKSAVEQKEEKSNKQQPQQTSSTNTSAGNQQQQQQPQNQQQKINLSEIEETKTQGNELFKKNELLAAKQKFYEGFGKIENQYLEQLQQNNDDVIKLYIQILSNAALCHVKLNENKEAIDLCNKAIKYDPNNCKALYRRGLSYKALAELVKPQSKNDDVAMKEQYDLYENSTKDLEKVYKVEFNNSKLKQEFEDVNKKYIALKIQFRDKLQQEESKKPKQKKPDQDDDHEEQKQHQEKDKKNIKVTHNLTAEQLDQVTKSAVQNQIEGLINSKDLPENPTIFEKNLTSFKKYPDKLFSYLKNIPSTHYSKIYANKDIPTDYLIQIIKCLNNDKAKEEKQVCKEIIEGLTNTYKFYICTMSLSKSEKRDIKSLFEFIQMDEKYYKVFELNK